MRLAGGKCANGAVSAAFASIYNGERAPKRFGGMSESLVNTPNSGREFDSINAAWSSALEEMVGLGKKYYPDEYKANTFIPELGVEIIENGGRYSYGGIVTGVQLPGVRFGWVSFEYPGNSNIAARGHMHWINIAGSEPDLASAKEYYDFRVSAGKPSYESYVGDWHRNYRVISRNGRPF